MTVLRYTILGCLLLNVAAAGEQSPSKEKSVAGLTSTDPNPIIVSVSSPTTIPTYSRIGGSYSQTYTLTSNLTYTMPTPFNNSVEYGSSSTEFTIADTCHGVSLPPAASCTITVGFTAGSAGKKSAKINVQYGKNKVPLTIASLSSSPSWVGLVGVDYQPNHYPMNYPFNYHASFYVGTIGGVPITNIYAELQQLQAAGYSTVRSYQTEPYVWSDMILQANSLGMNVIYEASIPQTGSQTDITAALATLDAVIALVTPAVFQSTVTLVLAGHENYDTPSNVTYLTSAITQLQAELTADGVTGVPVGTAVLGENFTSSSAAIQADMATLNAASSADAPVGFDSYPFQWGVTPPDQAVTNPALSNSIAWDYVQANYTGPKATLIAESGWATEGIGLVNPGLNIQYACYQNGVPSPNGICQPSLPNEGTYLTALYAYVADATNNAGVLVFEAYDEPGKNLLVTVPPYSEESSENYYGVFDSNCNLKANNVIPLNAAVSETGCQGIINGGLVTVVGAGTNSNTAQTPFVVSITQTNAGSSFSPNMTVTVPTANRNNQSTTPWPQFWVANGAVITVSSVGTTPTNVCSAEVTGISSSGVVTFAPTICTSGGGMNCGAGSNCYLPNPY